MSELLRIVGLIKEKKKAQIQWSQLTLDQRFLFLQQEITGRAKADAIADLAKEIGLTASEAQTYLVDWLQRFFQSRKSLLIEAASGSDYFYSALGITAVGTDSAVNLRNSLVFILDSLLSGNAVFVSCESSALQRLFVFSEAHENLVSFVLFNDEVFQFLIEHPAIKSVCGIFRETKQLQFERVALGKKTYCFVSHGKNAAVILPDFDPDLIRSKLMASMTLCHGQLPESISRIYCVEAAIPKFLEVLSECWPKDYSIDIGADADQVKKILEQIRSESGKPLFGRLHEDAKMSAILIKDLPNCSELMQQPLLTPIVTLTEIKYPFDAAKWVNNSDYAVCASIYGPLEKVTKFASKFEVGSVALNDWSFCSLTEVRACKSSQRGQLDCGPRSALYNFVGKLTH